MTIFTKLLVFALLVLEPTSAQNILILGDSWAAWATKSVVEALCPGSTVFNIAIGSTSAKCWANRDLDADLPDNFDPDYVYLSLGGNDYITKPWNKCMNRGGTSEVVGWITTVINELDAKYGSLGTKILLTGYGVPSESRIIFGLCDSLTVWTEVSKLYTEYTYPNSTTVIPVVELFGGSLAGGNFTPSSSDLYADCIHLNNKGLEVFFKHEPINNFFGGICTGSLPT